MTAELTANPKGTTRTAAFPTLCNLFRADCTELGNLKKKMREDWVEWGLSQFLWKTSRLTALTHPERNWSLFLTHFVGVRKSEVIVRVKVQNSFRQVPGEHDLSV